MIKNINTESLNFIKKYLPNKNINIDTNTYFWFSQFPIYEREITKNFLNFINFNNFNQVLDKMNWCCFEYILYIYYCVIFNSYKIINLNDLGLKLKGSLERKLTRKNLDFIRKHNLSINWQSNRHNDIIDENILILYHLNTF